MSGIMTALFGAGSASALAFVSSSSFEATNNVTSLTIPAPAGITLGDRMYVVLSCSVNDPVVTATLTGWTSVAASDAVGRHMLIYSKTATGSEPANYTFVFSGGGSRWGGAIVAYRGGQGLTDTIGAFTVTTSAPTITGASITPTAIGTLLFFGSRPNDQSAISSGPAGMTQRVLDGDQPARFVYDLALQPASATGAKTFTWNNNREGVGILVQIK